MKKIKVRVYGGDISELVLVSEDNGHVYICTEDEYQRARLEKREPKLVGFLKEHIVSEP